MSKSPKTMRAEAQWSRGSEKHQHSVMLSQKNDENGRFKIINHNQRHRIKSQPASQSIGMQQTRKNIKNQNQFSQQYLSLVNKLRINLSKQYFQKKRSKKKIIRERQLYYNDDLSQKRAFSISNDRQNNFSNQLTFKDTKIINKKSSLKNHQISLRNSQEYSKNQQFTHLNLKQLRLSLQSKDSKIPMIPRIQKSHSKDHMQNLGLQLYKIQQRCEPLKTVKRAKNNLAGKHLTKLKQQRKKIFLKPIEQYSQQQNEYRKEQFKDINANYQKVNEFLFHINILLDIYQCLNVKQWSQCELYNLSKLLKGYILGNKKPAGHMQKIIYDDISHLDLIYLQNQDRKQLRSLVFLERVMIVFSIDLMANSNTVRYAKDTKQILQSLLGLYYYFVVAFQKIRNDLNGDQQHQINLIGNKIGFYNIHWKKQITSLLIFVNKKLFPILKTNSVIMQQIKILMTQFQNRNVGINRSFYELLKLYAIYLNNNDLLIDKNYNMLKAFATCPSPYLTKPPTKNYTLVLDLDETLIHAHNEKNKLQIFMRPFVKQFLNLMASHFQLVIFTSSMPEYSEQIIDQLPQIQYRLFRYHTTRIKNKHIKDLSRLGRNIQKIIIVDNEEQNFALQHQNGIKITQWRGDDPTDQQLNVIGLFLSNLIIQSSKDVRQFLLGYAQFRKKYY